eukprot:2908536-Rhodomonas_salina.2
MHPRERQLRCARIFTVSLSRLGAASSTLRADGLFQMRVKQAQAAKRSCQRVGGSDVKHESVRAFARLRTGSAGEEKVHTGDHDGETNAT